MSENTDTTYVVTRHAQVRGHDDVLWVAVARWVYSDGTAQWCLEYWSDVGEESSDLSVADEAAAIRRAQEDFGVRDTDWQPGPQPWGRPD